MFGRPAKRASASGTSASVTNSWYASSITTSTPGGTPSTRRRRSAVRRAVLVGLFGFAMATTRVARPIEASTASTSTVQSVSGASRIVAPASSVNWG